MQENKWQAFTDFLIVDALFSILKICHLYDHIFPLRYKAQTGNETRVLLRSNKKFVKLCLRKQAHYKARGGEWAQSAS